MEAEHSLVCHLCGQAHRPIGLSPGDKARCVRCGAILAERWRSGPDTALAFALAGLVLSVPAVLLPFVTAGKWGAQHTSRLFTGVAALWTGGRPSLAGLVALCGALVPAAYLATLASVHLLARRRRPSAGALGPAARVLREWAFPEVQVLAVLVAVMKLGSLVNVEVRSGFWCYCGAALCLLIAQRGHHLELSAPHGDGPEGGER